MRTTERVPFSLGRQYLLTLTYALNMSGNPVYGTKRWKELRAQVIQDEPVCHWCRRAPSTQADHAVELDQGVDPYDRTNIVGSCASCNARRGAIYVNKKTATRIQQRNQTQTPKPPQKKKTETPFSFSDKRYVTGSDFFMIESFAGLGAGLPQASRSIDKKGIIIRLSISVGFAKVANIVSDTRLANLRGKLSWCCE